MSTSLLFDALVLALALLGVILYLYARASRRALLAERLKEELQRKGRQGEHTKRRLTISNLRQSAAELMRRLGAALPLFSQAQRLEIGQKLVMAGWRSPQALLTVAALAALAAAGLVTATILLLWPLLQDNLAFKLGSCLIAVYLGLLLPRIVLDRLVARRQRAIERSLPDALDLLVICTNAGLGLNSALQRVAEELAMVAPALSDELRLTSTELQISSDTVTVLERMAERIQLESVDSLVSTLIQSRQYGTAITQALRVLARSERTARLMRLEEQAAKLAVKITIPMMLFILPTVLIVGAGPAVLSLMDFFRSQ